MANISVNSEQWGAISADEQQKIIKGLKESGSLKADDTIVPDAKTPKYDPDKSIKLEWNPIKDACQIACDIAAGTAGAWCTANTAGVGLVVCLAASEAARQKCRDGC